MADSFDRFRSFAERYIIARAPFFRTGNEKEDAWLATQDAKTIYNSIETASRDPNVCDNAVGAVPSGNAGNHSSGYPGATAAHHSGPVQVTHHGPTQSPFPQRVPPPVQVDTNILRRLMQYKKGAK